MTKTAQFPADDFCIVRGAFAWERAFLFPTNLLDYKAQKIERQTAFLDPASETDDLIYLSCLPWFDLTCCTNERKVDVDDAIPRIKWGKYVKEGDREVLGLSIEVNHRLIDGVHLGRFYERLQEKLSALEG